MMSTSFLYYIFKQLLCISNFYSIARNTFKRQGLFLIFYKNSFAPSTIITFIIIRSGISSSTSFF